MSPEPIVTATRYEVCCLPEGHIDAPSWTIAVEYRGRDLWAVVRSAKRCLSIGGTWDWEPFPSDRDDAWLKAHRFDLDTALRYAKFQAPVLRVNGMTAADVLALDAARGES